jgi:hypothetical protein
LYQCFTVGIAVFVLACSARAAACDDRFNAHQLTQWIHFKHSARNPRLKHLGHINSELMARSSLLFASLLLFNCAVLLRLFYKSTADYHTSDTHSQPQRSAACWLSPLWIVW